MTSTIPADKTARDDAAAIEFGVKISLDWLAVAQRAAVAGVTTGEQVQA